MEIKGQLRVFYCGLSKFTLLFYHTFSEQIQENDPVFIFATETLQLRLHNIPMKIFYSTTRVYYMLLTFCYEELASVFTSEGGKLLTKERLRHAFNFANFSWMGIWVFLEVFEKPSPGTRVWCLLPYYSLSGSWTPQNWINLCYTTLLENTTADPTQV